MKKNKGAAIPPEEKLRGKPQKAKINKLRYAEYYAEQRRYYYVDENHHFVPVSFSPFLANRINQNESGGK